MLRGRSEVGGRAGEGVRCKSGVTHPIMTRYTVTASVRGGTQLPPPSAASFWRSTTQQWLSALASGADGTTLVLRRRWLGRFRGRLRGRLDCRCPALVARGRVPRRVGLRTVLLFVGLEGFRMGGRRSEGGGEIVGQIDRPRSSSGKRVVSNRRRHWNLGLQV